MMLMMLALLVQEADEAATEEIMRSMEGMLGELEAVSDDLEADSGPEATARAIVRMTEAAFANSPYPVFSLHDRDGAIAEATPAMEAMMNYSGGNPSDYSLDYAVNAFRKTEDETPDYAFCEAGAPDTVAEERGIDPAGHELTLRICWYGRTDPETGDLIGSYIYQLNNGSYYVQYRGGIAGPDEAGIDERLPMVEDLIEPLMERTVIAPGAE